MNDSLGKAPAGEQDGGPVRMSRQELRSSLWLASLYAIRMLGLFLVLPVFALYARQLPGGDDPAWVGFAFGAYGLTQALLQIPYGAASDRFGRKQVITVGLLVMAAGERAGSHGRHGWRCWPWAGRCRAPVRFGGHQCVGGRFHP